MQSKANMVKMYEMRLEGKTLEEISQCFGITRERVRQILSGTVKSPGRTISKCVFPGLVIWMRNNCVTVKKLGADLDIMHKQSLQTKLWGRRPFTMPEIKAILAYTGLTFEEAFGTEIKTVRKED